MRWNSHSDLAGRHAFLGASKFHWVNYDENKMARVYKTALAAQRGTELHEFAHNAIRLGVRLRGSNDTLASYVNDAIGFGMSSEQVLYYSANCFGTADSIAFKRNKLRIHDLKTGVHPGSEHQLEVYSALFCLEYGYNPNDIEIELRIYQSNEVNIFTPDPTEIIRIMDKIKEFDKLIDKIRSEDL